MAEKKNKNNSISSIKVMGFKSFDKENCIDIKPLTILSGSNSSGKSSIFQPILLMKQTLDESFDPGVLQLNGANVKFSSSSQVFTKGSSIQEFYVEVKDTNGTSIGNTYVKRGESKAGLELKSMKIGSPEWDITLKQSMTSSELENVLEVFKDEFFYNLYKDHNMQPAIKRKRCFLEIDLIDSDGDFFGMPRRFNAVIERSIRDILHLPGLRGNPERNYPVTGIDFEKMYFAGTFEKYVASIIAQWKDTKNNKMLVRLKKYLNQLGLAKNIDAKYINDTEIALHVSRSNSSEDDDTVSIADVGLGLSQTLPILVALLVAKQGQIVYIEQPEIHLHPRAQYELAAIFADSIKRGVIIVAETHSSVFLRGIQTLVAANKLSREKVKLHWFLREPQTGYSFIESADMDENGSFGDWPEDFDDTTLLAEAKYLDAVEKRLLGE